jgi:NADH dehydrogenase/NADH:ubiquinone oxidoreductase subunit G
VLAVVAKTQDEKAAAAVANVTDPAESARERAEVERKRVELERRKKAYLAKKQADALARTEAAASKTPGKKDSKQRQLVVAKAGYASKEETKLSFGPRDIVRVISTKNGNWHYGVLLRSSTHPVGSKGYYPPNYFIPMPTKKSAGGHG